MGRKAACYSHYSSQNKQVTIYTECLYKKSGWDDAWNGTTPNTVFWGCTLDDNSCVEMIATDVVRLTDKNFTLGVNAPYKEGLTLVGWANNPNSSGASYTVKTIYDGASGPLYCIWKTSILPIV